MARKPAEDWRERFRQIHQQKGLVQAIQYLRDAGINQSEIRLFLEQEKAAGRIPKLPEPSSGNVV
jgi:DNA-binding transcriptional MerR regulator